MPNFRTRPIFHDRQIVQYSGNSVTLSGVTIHDVHGHVVYDPTILYENPLTASTAVFPFTAFTPTYVTGMTQYTLAGLTGYQYPETFRPNGVPLIINPPIRRVGFDLAMTGGTGTTTVDVTGYVLRAIDAQGSAMWDSISSLSADTNTYVSSASVDCGTNILTLTRNDAVNVTVDLTCIVSGSTTFTGNTSGTCITDLWITNLHGCSPITVHDNIQTTTSSATGTTSFAWGVTNKAYGISSFVAGGRLNRVSGNYSHAEGFENIVVGNASHVQGRSNFVGGSYSHVGGFSNLANSTTAFIGGGRNNQMSANTAFYSTIVSGDGNKIYSDSVNGIIGVGKDNIIIGGNYNTIVNGLDGLIDGGFRNTIIGGQNNKVQAAILSTENTIIGGYSNRVSGGRRLLIGGGNGNIVGNSYSFQGYADYSTILNGLNNIISGHTKGSTIVNGRDNTISRNTGYFVGSSKYSNIGGGRGNTIKTPYTVIGGGRDNNIGTNAGNYGVNTFIGGGRYNSIDAGYSSIVGGKNNVIDRQLFGSDQQYSFIGGGKYNTLTTGSTYSSILAGQSNTVKHSNSHIIGSLITSTDNDMTYTDGLTVTGNWLIHSDTKRLATDFTTISSVMNGSITSFNTTFSVGHLTDNGNPSGNTGMYFGNFTDFPTTNQHGTLLYYGSGFTRSGTPLTGTDFYRNKVVLRGAEDIDGMVINPSSNTSGIGTTLWFEIGGDSVGVLNNDKWGFGLASDGTEMPNATVQVGSTGNTASFVYNPSSIPTTSGDTGMVGEHSWDDTYFYIRTNTGWGRIALDYAF